MRAERKALMAVRPFVPGAEESGIGLLHLFRKGFAIQDAADEGCEGSSDGFYKYLRKGLV